MGGLGGFEWLIIILVVLLLFGAKRIPELARGLGQGINEFRKASDEIKQEINEGTKGTNRSSSSSQPSGSQPEARSESDSQPKESDNSEQEQTTQSTDKENKTK